MKMSNAARRFLLLGLLLACGACGEHSGHGGGASADGGAPDAGAPAVRFPEMLGATAVLEDTNPDPNVVEVSLTAQMATVDLAGGPIEMMTYNGHFPGPLLQAKVGDEVIVHFSNQLAEPTTVHWHGVRVTDAMDGVPRIQEPVQPGGTFTYRFVVRDAGTFWYHPHVRANEQIEKGLYGPLLVRSRVEPVYDAERLVILDDVLLDAGDFAPFLSDHMEEMHGRFGNVLLSNGKDIDALLAEPVFEGRVERWRIFNTSNARTMTLSLEGARWRVIGTDGGLLRAPYEVEKLEVAVGQRYDVEVSFDRSGPVRLFSHVLTLDENNDVVVVPFPVFSAEAASTAIPPREIAWPDLGEPSARTQTSMQTLRFDVVQDAQGHLLWRINGIAHPDAPLFTFAEGDTVRLRLQNAAGPEHPFHLHGQFFEILAGGAPSTTQPGLKDTVLVPGGRTVEILAYFDNPGRWMAHCHILEHAALGMHTEFIVTPKDGDGGVSAAVDGGGGHHGH